jgi:hypothetical protein
MDVKTAEVREIGFLSEESEGCATFQNFVFWPFCLSLAFFRHTDLSKRKNLLVFLREEGGVSEAIV